MSIKTEFIEKKIRKVHSGDVASRGRQMPLILFLLFFFVAGKKCRKAQRALKKQASSPNFQLKDKAVKVSHKLKCNCPRVVTANYKPSKLLSNLYERIRVSSSYFHS